MDRAAKHPNAAADALLGSAATSTRTMAIIAAGASTSTAVGRRFISSGEVMCEVVYLTVEPTYLPTYTCPRLTYTAVQVYASV